MSLRALTVVWACSWPCSLMFLMPACGSSEAPASPGGAGSPGSAGASVSAAGSSSVAGAGVAGVGNLGASGAINSSAGASSAAGSESTGASGAGGANSAAAGSSGSAAGSGSVATTEKFSFFVTSWAGLQRLAKDFGLPNNGVDGFGGDLRYGETGPGAGLRGADKICATLAEASMPGAGAKGWRAFLSASDDGTGKPVNAIDRVGTGPWYDRLGRLFGNTVTDIAQQRPANADATIKNDFPNENGVPNHQPDPNVAAVDNHDMLTGSDETGKLLDATSNCLNWTSAMGDTAKEGKPRVGHSWPRSMGGGGFGGGFGGGMGGPSGIGDMNNWMSALTESGCKAGANLVEQGGPMANAVTVGSGGGYGGFYCFALKP
ncbi:MAG TPA: hypothetical protein VFK05_31450 [Polyangiaceae bacterium]|nr:hypothetical protein [Polyangiaceae bacterium]